MKVFVLYTTRSEDYYGIVDVDILRAYMTREAAEEGRRRMCDQQRKTDPFNQIETEIEEIYLEKEE